MIDKFVVELRPEAPHDLTFGMGVAGNDTGLGLAHDSRDPRRQVLQSAAQPIQYKLPPEVRGLLDARADLLGKALGLTDHPAGGRE